MVIEGSKHLFTCVKTGYTRFPGLVHPSFTVSSAPRLHFPGGDWNIIVEEND